MDKPPKVFRYMSSCDACPLHKQRTNVVIGRGPLENIRYMFVGEAPGADEDESGMPFVGASGKKLMMFMEQAGIDIETVYVTNTVKCLKAGSRVYLPDGSSERIDKLVKDEYRGPVLSFDEATGKFVTRNVTATHRSPLGNRRWLRVTYEGAKRTGTNGTVRLIVTNDHEFLTESGKWERADKLNGKMINVGPFGLSDVSRDTAIGGMLGDSHISKNSGSMQCSHSIHQEEWMLTKAGVFESHVYPPKKIKVGRKVYQYVSFFTKNNREFRHIRDQFYDKSGRKTVPRWLPKKINARIAAVWFLDDGHTGSSNNCDIAVIRYDPDSVRILIQALKALKVKANTQCDGTRIFIPKSEAVHFLKMIAPYVPPSMRYKLGSVSDLPDYDPSLWTKQEPAPYYAKALVTEEKGVKDTLSYCLTVDGTNNFVTPAGVVHNCRPPDNRTPFHNEVKACAVHLHLQMRILKPPVIVTVGNTPLQFFLPSKKIMQSHGQVLSARTGQRIFPIIHPAAALRNPEYNALILADLKKLARLKDTPSDLIISPRIV